jgi:hypothetical protein
LKEEPGAGLDQRRFGVGAGVEEANFDRYFGWKCRDEAGNSLTIVTIDRPFCPCRAGGRGLLPLARILWASCLAPVWIWAGHKTGSQRSTVPGNSRVILRQVGEQFQAGAQPVWARKLRVELKDLVIAGRDRKKGQSDFLLAG